jgi:two-component system, OmpR family, response regulator
MAEGGNRRWILVAEDEAILRSSWCAALERAGYRTIEAGDECEALALLNKTVPDLILLDEELLHLSLPDPVRETDLLSGVIEARITQAIPVVLVASPGSAPPQVPGLNVQGRLPKSAEFQALLAAVRGAFEAEARMAPPMTEASAAEGPAT